MEFDTIDTSLWDEIQDMPGEIFDIEEIREQLESEPEFIDFFAANFDR